MSRIGQKPVKIPEGVQAKVTGQTVTIKGPKGELSRTLHPSMTIEINDDTIQVSRPNDSKLYKSLHGLSRTLIANMVEGVTRGFEKVLILHGIGYRAEAQGGGLNLSLGFSHPVRYDPPEGIEIQAESLGADRQRIVVRGMDKERVGQTAAEIRSLKKVEPFKGKGIRYEGEYVRRKAGKAGRIGGVGA